MSKNKQAPDIFSSIAAVYLLISAGAALGIILGSISNGVTILDMPSWAWVYCAVAIVAAGVLGSFGRRKRYLRAVLGVGFFPVTIVFLLGATQDPQQMDVQIELFRQTPRELFAPFGWIALLGAPTMGLLASVIGWAEDRGMIGRGEE